MNTANHDQAQCDQSLSKAVRSGAGLDELEAALQVLVRHAGRDGGYSPYYGQWQDILHGLGRLIASKRRDLPNKGSTNEPKA